jgi:hypothetical protein
MLPIAMSAWKHYTLEQLYFNWMKTLENFYPTELMGGRCLKYYLPAETNFVSPALSYFPGSFVYIL